MKSLQYVLFVFIMSFLLSCESKNNQKEKVSDQTEKATQINEQKSNKTANSDKLQTHAVKVTKKEPSVCHLKIGWASWEPYQYKGRDGKVTGMDIDIINEAIKRTSCKVNYIEGDWADLLRQLKKGTLDAVASATLTEKRRKYAYFSEPYRAETFALYVKNKDLNRYSGMSLKSMLDSGLRVGAVVDYFYGTTLNDLQDNEKYAHLFNYNDFSENNFVLLFDSKIDAVLEDPFVGADFVRRKGWGDLLVRLPLVIHSGDVHLMFSKKSVSESTVELLNNALAKIKADGTYENILKHYGG